MRSLAPAVLAIVLLAALYPGATLAQPAPAPTPEPAPATAAPTAPPAPPTAAPLPAPTASPSASPSAPPTAVPTGPYHYIVAPPPAAPGQPAILEIALNDQTLHVGAPYSVRVRTTPDVTTLSVSTMGNTFGMQGAGPGLFASDGQVPSFVPFFFINRNYTLVVTAQTADKRTTSFSVTLRLEK
jgi:hypothetical protein